MLENENSLKCLPPALSTAFINKKQSALLGLAFINGITHNKERDNFIKVYITD